MKYFIIIYTFLFIIFNNNSYAQFNYKKATALGVTYLLPQKAELKKTEPMWGGELSGYWKNLKLSLGVSVGNVEKDFGGGYNIKTTDILTNISLNYLFGSFPDDDLIGFYGMIGAGYYMENFTFEGKVFQQNVKDEIKGESAVIDVGAGYFFSSAAIEARYLYLLNSKNVTEAVYLNIIIFVGGEK